MWRLYVLLMLTKKKKFKVMLEITSSYLLDLDQKVWKKNQTLLLNNPFIFVGEGSVWDVLISAWGKDIFDLVKEELSFIWLQDCWDITGFKKWLFFSALFKWKQKKWRRWEAVIDLFICCVLSLFICSLPLSLSTFSIGSAQLIWVGNFSEYYSISFWIVPAHWPEDRTLHPVGINP